jgi:hypothetical protein
LMQKGRKEEDSMANESGSADQPRWLVEPPGPQDIKFQIATGDQVEITAEIRQAFDGLLAALAGGDVEGYTASECVGYIKGCSTNTFACTPRRVCTSESQQPCFILYHCLIAPTPG